jgi:hypothetical protein
VGHDHISNNPTVNNNIRLTPWAGVVSVIAAAIGAVGLYALMHDEPGTVFGQGSSPSPTATSAADPQARGDSKGSPGAAVAPEESNSPAQESPRVAEPAEQWQGTLLLDTSGGKDLDGARPTTVNSFTVDGDIALGLMGDGWQVMAPGGGAVSQWKGDGKPPGQAACAESVDTTGSPYAPVSLGTVLCVRTDGGRIARLQVTKLPEDYTFGVQFDAVVWRLAADAAANS